MTAAANGRSALVVTAREAFALGEDLDWRSHDPYDVLLSPFARPLRSRWPLAARIVIQLGKRSATLRSLLRVSRHEEPKALADFIQAGARLTRRREDWARRHVQELSIRLERAAVRTPDGYGWGLQFPWVSRYGRMAAGEPNNYTTTSASHALLDAYDLETRPAALTAARAGGEFILRGLGSFAKGGQEWLRYTVGSTSPIINIQASSAGLLARIASYGPDESFIAAADRAVEAVVASQAANGSWTYSADGRGRFVDGFHTGFTLQGLHEYARWRGEEAFAETFGAIDRGFGYFTRHLVDDEGMPLGFADGRVDLGGQNVAQAIQTLLVCGGEDEKRAARRIWSVAVANGGFNRRPALLRWEVGPMVLATAFLIDAAG